MIKSLIKGLILLAVMFFVLPAAFGYISDLIFSDYKPPASEPAQVEEDYPEFDQEAAEQEYLDRTMMELFEQNPDAISYDEAEDHIGEYVSMFATVADVDTKSADGNPIFVDFGASYPSPRVTGVIWPEYKSQFPDIKDIEGDIVYVEGTLYEYNGTPNIELTDSFQIQETH